MNRNSLLGLKISVCLCHPPVWFKYYICGHRGNGDGVVIDGGHKETPFALKNGSRNPGVCPPLLVLASKAAALQRWLPRPKTKTAGRWVTDGLARSCGAHRGGPRPHRLWRETPAWSACPQPPSAQHRAEPLPATPPVPVWPLTA